MILLTEQCNSTNIPIIVQLFTLRAIKFAKSKTIVVRYNVVPISTTTNQWSHLGLCYWNLSNACFGYIWHFLYITLQPLNFKLAKFCSLYLLAMLWMIHSKTCLDRCILIQPLKLMFAFGNQCRPKCQPRLRNVVSCGSNFAILKFWEFWRLICTNC